MTKTQISCADAYEIYDSFGIGAYISLQANRENAAAGQSPGWVFVDYRIPCALADFNKLHAKR